MQLPASTVVGKFALAYTVSVPPNRTGRQANLHGLGHGAVAAQLLVISPHNYVLTAKLLYIESHHAGSKQLLRSPGSTLTVSLGNCCMGKRFVNALYFESQRKTCTFTCLSKVYSKFNSFANYKCRLYMLFVMTNMQNTHHHLCHKLIRIA